MSTGHDSRQVNQDGVDNLLPHRSKVIAMVNQLERLKETLTEDKLKGFDGAELSVRLDYVENINKSYDIAQSLLEENDSTESSDRMSFLSLYFDVKAKLSRKLAHAGFNPLSSTIRQFSLDHSSSSNTSSLRQTRVPEIQLPKFSGSYCDWSSFFALFSTVIHDNNELSCLEKFHYLRSNLEDVALDTIAAIELKEENYEVALSLLKNRFDNKLLNFQALIKGVFSLKNVESGSAMDLRSLSDKMNAHLRAMLTLGDKEQIADGLLIYLVTSKLDETSQMKWEESLPINQLPKWKSMAEFLERRCRMVENLEYSMTNRVNGQQGFKKYSQQNRHVHVSSASSSNICSLCNSTEHFISSCPNFLNMVPYNRFKEIKRLKLCLNCLRKGHMLKDCVSGVCRRCSAKHNTLLHMDNYNIEHYEEPPVPTTSQAVLASSSLIPNQSSFSPSTIFLATAIILVKNLYGAFVPCRAILDSASQLNLITNRFVKNLHLKCNKVSATVCGIGHGNLVIEKSVDVDVKSQQGDFSTFFTAMVVPSITDYQPSNNISTLDWNIPRNIKLADASFDKGGRIDILIGAELFFELISVGQIKMAENLPILQKTLFGWVVAGGFRRSHHSYSLAAACRIANEEEEEQLSSVLKRFWEVENDFKGGRPLTNEDVFCENHFVMNTVRLASGEYSVRLPQRDDCNIESLGESYDRALQRFRALEKKLGRFPEVKAQYVTFMSEYAKLNHMSLILSQESPKKYFLPHHCVHKHDSTSTKLRVVFDGSAKTTTGLSLNDVLYAGPTIQPKLFNTLLRYRFFKVALSGDICKMYRCVRVSHPDDYLQCILWRDNVTDEIKTYKLNTVTYGTKPAAFLAIRAMQQLASDEESNYPLGANIVRRDFYVDDMISGGDTVDEVLKIRQQVTELLQKGNFQIRKWCSNMADVLEGIPPEQCEKMLKFHDGTDVTKTLGLVWDPKSDNFIFSFAPVNDSKIVTKRSILSSIARIYDPLGLIGPVITKAKLFMQHLWKLQLQWDESLPQSLHSSWLQYVSKFSAVQRLSYPRFVAMANSSVQIHAFCDASLSAYGVCVYVRTESGNTVKTNLLCSKSRVAPLKSLTVPKLELSAALLLAELVDDILNTMSFSCEVHCWSDSMVVLSWLREEPSNFNVFVSNRVSSIQSLTKKMVWHYVPTDMNPADILSRGATPDDLFRSTLWKNGPNFLSHDATIWPDNIEFLTELPDRRRNVLTLISLTDLCIQCKYHNSFAKMQRIFAYVYKFLYLKLKNPANWLLKDEIKNGTYLLIRNIQLVHFASEYKLLKSNKNISSSSKLYSLAPVIDSFGLIRVGGRLQNSYLDYDAQHPIILPKGHPFVVSLVLHFHEKLLHAGPQCLLASIRQQYWPIGGRKQVSSIISKCVRCFRIKPKIKQHVMGALPMDRVRPNKAFHTTGIDFCGPFYYKSNVRNRPPVKCYVSIFVCFATKATHLEVAEDLSTQSFLLALKRFIAIRGKPTTIWSDNATNFVGAKNELSDLKRLFMGQNHLQCIHQQCLDDGIEWKFIPPRSPHFGGLWEAAVKSAKYHFYRTVGLKILTVDELRTLVYQISAILNSRPLCPISEDPNDLDILTPGHFLVGGPLISLPEPDITGIDLNRISRWQSVCHMQQTFWKRWSSSYLSLLQERSKWREHNSDISCGLMVLLKDDNLPPLKWQMARVTEVIRGDDGVVRVVIVRTSSGVMKRAVSKVAVLPIE